MEPSRKLFAIKALHTLAWGFFAGCIVAIPLTVHAGKLDVAGVLIAVVFVEVMIVAINRGRCPLTDVAARYTADRADNFDIFLPAWLARYNKAIFGALYLGTLLYALVSWLEQRGAA